jgi:signal transduction histidine kinase
MCSDEAVAVGELFGRLRDRPWWDAFVALMFFVIGTYIYLFPIFENTSNKPLSLRIGVLALACTSLLFRRRAPLVGLGIAVTFAGIDLYLGYSVPLTIVLVDLLHNATLYSSQRASRVLVAIVVIFVVLVGLAAGVLSTNLRMAVSASLQGFAVLIVPVWWAVNIRQHREIAEVERANTRQLGRIAELDRRAAVAAERSRMARDLHDVVAGHLSAIAIQSEALLSMVDGDRATVRSVLKSVRENSVQSLDEMRAMIGVLRDDAGSSDPRTAPARLSELDRLVDSARAGGLSVGVERKYDVDDLPVAVDLAAYRIVQEALTNVLKHAAGGDAHVEVRSQDDGLVVEVTNELTGEPGTGTGTGLVSMAERAQAVGGSFSAGPRDGGWRVRAVLPTGG